MKKSYIVLITIAVFGVAAIAVYPSQKDEDSNTISTENSTTTTSAQEQPADIAEQSTTQDSTITNANSETLNDGTFTGTNESTPFGDLKIAIVVSNGIITDVTFLAVPEDDRKSVQINDVAMPELESQTITVQSSDIDAVTGATYTSDAYINSLQAAIDASKGA